MHVLKRNIIFINVDIKFIYNDIIIIYDDIVSPKILNLITNESK